MIRLGIGLLLLGVTACSSSVEPIPETRDFRADMSFTADEQIAIRDYLNQLSIITKQHIGITFDYPHPEQVSKSRDELGRRVIIRNAGPDGLTTMCNRVISIGDGRNTYSPQLVALVAAHEVGHDLGFLHVVSDTTALMAPIIESYTFRWTQADQDECARVHICPQAEVN